MKNNPCRICGSLFFINIIIIFLRLTILRHRFTGERVSASAIYRLGCYCRDNISSILLEKASYLQYDTTKTKMIVEYPMINLHSSKIFHKCFKRKIRVEIIWFSKYFWIELFKGEKVKKIRLEKMLTIFFGQ